MHDESDDDDLEARRFWEELAESPVVFGVGTKVDKLAHVSSLSELKDQGWRRGCKVAGRLSRLQCR